MLLVRLLLLRITIHVPAAMATTIITVAVTITGHRRSWCAGLAGVPLSHVVHI